ncbi:DEAD/DEAH box helicase [Saccharopolyspora tripterygii]
MVAADSVDHLRKRHPTPEGALTLTDGPLIVQSDKTLLLEVDHDLADDARTAIAPFAELERAPEHVHTYRITPLALWNARAAGHDAEQVVDGLVRFSRYPVPQPLLVDIVETMGRFGRLQLTNDPANGLVLVSLDRAVLEEVLRNKKIAPMLGARVDDDTVVVHPSERGRLKQMLLKVGWPAEDLAGYVDGEAHPIELHQDGWNLRDYQRQAVQSFWAGGSGVVVLPCGAGKTLVGAAAMAEAAATTLILVTNTVAGRQWKRELIERTSLTEEEIGEYSGEKKEIRPVTIATYQVITRRSKGEYKHLELFDSRDWGLVVYDEVHLLPAPVFRMTADLQSRRRLGLTATLVREDGREGDVFSLIGPKRYDAPWKDIEAQGWIAPAECVEVRVTLTDNERLQYATSEAEERYKLCATARTKAPVVKAILDQHPDEPALVIGAYLDQLHELGEALDAPIIEGSTKNKEREELFDAFRRGEINRLVVSKVANFSIDLPEASVAVQVSGTFGSRQEEAQRLGRLLRPKSERKQAHFYSVVSRDTLDTDYAAHRQRFLAEQGYAYRIVDADDLLGPALPDVG